jgi:MFS family permease
MCDLFIRTNRVFSFLDREHTIAGEHYSRWLVPPAALAIHLSIGQAYAFSVFNLPLSRAVGISTSAPDDWKLSTIGWVFSIAIVFLGLSAAVFGAWLERVGPRKAMFVSALCFASGFQVAAVGVVTHQFWLLLLGYGVLGGIGLGLGYISPVSTLIRWFPDPARNGDGSCDHGLRRRCDDRVAAFDNAHDLLSKPDVDRGRADVRGDGRAVFRVHDVRRVHGARPSLGMATARWVAPDRPKALVTTANVTASRAIHTPQFWLLWMVLCLNVTAGNRCTGPSITDDSGNVSWRDFSRAAAGFVGLLSLANMGGRFFWSSLSDRIGRKGVYGVFFLLGAVLYALVPATGRAGSVALFVLGYVVIISMYGGGFATIPAYLRDMFGTIQVGAIHGRLLTAWSVAGVLGPVLVNYIREYQIGHGVAKADAYTVTMRIMAALLVLGFVCNALIRAVDARFAVSEDDAALIERSRQSGAFPARTLRDRPESHRVGAAARAGVVARRAAARVGRWSGLQKIARPVSIRSSCHPEERSDEGSRRVARSTAFREAGSSLNGLDPSLRSG